MHQGLSPFGCQTQALLRSLSAPFSEFGVSTLNLLYLQTPQIPNRMRTGRSCPLGPPIQAKIWELLVPDHTPPKGLQRKSPTWAGLIRWRFEISG